MMAEANPDRFNIETAVSKIDWGIHRTIDMQITNERHSGKGEKGKKGVGKQRQSTKATVSGSPNKQSGHRRSSGGSRWDLAELSTCCVGRRSPDKGSGVLDVLDDVGTTECMDRSIAVMLARTGLSPGELEVRTGAVKTVELMDHLELMAARSRGGMVPALVEVRVKHMEEEKKRSLATQKLEKLQEENGLARGSGPDAKGLIGVMQDQMLAPVHEEHVLGVVIESCLHHHIAEHQAQQEYRHRHGAGSFVAWHQRQGTKIENQYREKSEYGDRGEIIGQQVLGLQHRATGEMSEYCLLLLRGL